VVIDTGMNGSNGVQKLREKGIRKIDALIFSHDHSDHYGLYKDFIEAFRIGHVYMPDQSGVRKYQPAYAKRMDAVEAYCKWKGIPVTYLSPGEALKVGEISIKCLFIPDPDKLPEKDGHHFINNMSMVLRVTVGKWRALLGGDLSADGIKQMLASGIDVTCDIFKFLWHSDRGAITKALAEALKAVVAYTQYHHKEGTGNGRKSTHDLLRAAGALVVRVCEDGPISMVITGDTLTVTAGAVKKTFRK
jgi:competence protein ComEC